MCCVKAEIHGAQNSRFLNTKHETPLKKLDNAVHPPPTTLHPTRHSNPCTMSMAVPRSIKHRKIAFGQLQRHNSGTEIRSSKSPATKDKDRDKLNAKIPQPSDDYAYLRNLIHKTLYPDQELNSEATETLLPPLTSSNTLDVSIYALFALLLKNFVYSWYTDKLDLGGRDSFTKELVYLLAHISRELQSRITKYDDEFVKLLILDIPYLVGKHIQSIDMALCYVAREVDSEETEGIDAILVERWCQANAEELDDPDMRYAYRQLLVDNITRLILPHENVESRISHEFVVSLLDGIVLKSVIDSFADNFVIWDLIGKISKTLIMKKEEKDALIVAAEKIGSNSREEVSIIHRILTFFIVERTYTMKKVNFLQYAEFTPLFSLLNIILHIDVRFPILLSIFQVVFYWLLQINLFKRFTSNAIKRTIFTSVSPDNIAKAICGLRHLMFPIDDSFDMKPRYVPQNEVELQAVYDQNLQHLIALLKSKSPASRMLLSDIDAEDDQFVERKARYVMDTFKYRIINELLIQRLLDATLNCIFPELHYPLPLS